MPRRASSPRPPPSTGRVSPPADTKTTRAPRLDDVVAHWLDHIQRRLDLAPTTIVTYARVGQHLAAWGTNRALGDIDLAEYALARQEADVAPRTIALELRVAATLFRWARQTDAVPADAVLRVPKVRVDAGAFVLNHTTPTPTDAAKALAAMPDDEWRRAAFLLARTGARVGEVVTLRGCDLDERSRRIAFGNVKGASKTGLRWFPLDTASLQDLAGRSRRGAAPLFDFDDVTAPIQALDRRIGRACLDAGVTPFTPHGLRRMVVGRLIRARVDPGTAASLTGHSVQVMLLHYQQVTDEDRRTAAELANLGVLDGPPARRAKAR